MLFHNIHKLEVLNINFFLFKLYLLINAPKYVTLYLIQFEEHLSPGLEVINWQLRLIVNQFFSTKISHAIPLI